MIMEKYLNERLYFSESGNFIKMKKPISSLLMFNALKNEKCIIMACNVRVTKGMLKGILRAAKELDAPFMFEAAMTESNLDYGYTGLTPSMLSERIIKAASEVDYDMWVLHADHIKIKKGTQEEMEKVKELVAAQINADFTSFAIDASHLFNFDGKTVEEELEPNIRATIEIAKFIEGEMKGRSYGLEVEVGEVGRKNSSGMILTTPEEAVKFIKALNSDGVYPNFLAIANGSSHGDIYDKDGNLVPQLNIDIKLTKKIGKALRKNKLDVRIAQHGTTGTPLKFIKKKFPRKYILKCNVGTLWQDVVFDVLKEWMPELYGKMYNWTIETYREEAEKKQITKPDHVFGVFGKHSVKQFFNEIYAMDDKTEKAIEENTYKEALKFFDAFKAKGKASVVRDFIK